MKISLDARRMNRKKEAHIYLKEQLGFPDYYGNNLDALHDCLTDLRDAQVEFEHMEEAGEYFAKVYRVFRDAARENPELTLSENSEL